MKNQGMCRVIPIATASKPGAGGGGFGCSHLDPPLCLSPGVGQVSALLVWATLPLSLKPPHLAHHFSCGEDGGQKLKNNISSSAESCFTPWPPLSALSETGRWKVKGWVLLHWGPCETRTFSFISPAQLASLTYTWIICDALYSSKYTIPEWSKSLHVYCCCFLKDQSPLLLKFLNKIKLKLRLHCSSMESCGFLTSDLRGFKGDAFANFLFLRG